MCCENASAQTQSRSTRPTVNTSRQVQASTPVTPAPDFWAASGTENGATLAEVDRLDRKKLVMVYQYIYEENYRTDFSRQNAFQTPELSGRKSLIRRFPLWFSCPIPQNDFGGQDEKIAEVFLLVIEYFAEMGYSTWFEEFLIRAEAFRT